MSVSPPSGVISMDRSVGVGSIAPLIGAMLVFAGLSMAAAIGSKGFLEADACTHYVFARHALVEHHYLVDVWGRPLCTMLYALPAKVWGVVGVRGVSLALALVSAGVTFSIAKWQGFRLPAVAAICLLAQPLFFLHSFSELTEIPFATVLILAFWAYQRRRWGLMALLVALGPLARPEGFGFLALGALALLAHRKWWWIALLPLPLLAWTYAGWVIWGRPAEYPWWMWLGKNWPYSSTSVYESGPLLGWTRRASGEWVSSFLIRLPVIVSPLLFPFFWIGLWQSAQGNWLTQDHRRRCGYLIAAIPLMILVGHSLLWWLGKMASNGELRYLLVVAPFWALLTAKGWEVAFAHFNWRWPHAWAGVAALAPILVNVAYPVVPLPRYTTDYLAADVVQWLKENDTMQREYPRLMMSLPHLYYELDISPTDRTRALGWSREQVTLAPAGTIMIWDPIYGCNNSNQALLVSPEVIAKAGWVFVRHFECYDASCDVYLSPRTITNEPTRAGDDDGIRRRRGR